MPGPAAVRTRRDGKREAILAAALALFGRYGFRRTSIDDIAREAGVAKGTIYLYVENKEALFRTLSQSLLDGVLAAARTAAGSRGAVAERLIAILDAKFGFFHALLHRSPHANELLDSKSRLCADVFEAGDRAYATLLTNAIAAAARGGELAPARHGLGPGDVAQLLVAGAHGIGASQPGALDDVQYRTRLGAFVRLVVDGLRPLHARPSRPPRIPARER